MSRTIEIAISGNCTLGLAPLRIRQEGDDYLVGEQGSRSYLVMQAVGTEVVRMLQAGHTPAQVKQALCVKYATPDITLVPFLQSLVQAGFVRTVAGRPVVASPPSPAKAVRMHRRHVAWLFTAPMLALYAALILAGLAIAVLQPGLLPRPRDVILAQNYAFTVLATILISVTNVAKHEAAHVIAAKYLGVDARCSLGHRLFFPVIQTDLTDLWLVDPRRRYIAYVAGMVSDLEVAALLLIVLWLAAHGSLMIGQMSASAMKLAIIVIVGGIVWQFNLFMRTDVYYIIANALRCRDLAHDARRYLLHRARKLFGKAALADAPVLSKREARVVPVYTAILVLGTTAAVLTAAAYVFGVLSFVFVKGHTGISMPRGVAPGPQARAAVAGMLAITVALLGVSLVRGRRRERITYRLIPMGEL
jgi:hypothetical protein